LDARRRAVGEHVALILAAQWAIIRGDRHRSEHARIDVLGKYPIELKMVERPLDSARRINRARNEIPQPADGARLICARRYGDLVHAAPDSLFACVLAARLASPFVRVMRRPYESCAGLSRERPWQSIPKGKHEKSEGAQAPPPLG